MAEEGFAWIYLIFFLIIPLSRILPRVIRKFKDKGSVNPEQITPKYQSTNESFRNTPRTTSQSEMPKELSPQSLDMLVLGELNRGTKNFNSIQNNLGIDSLALEKILQSLEEQGLMKVQNKQGILGPKVELILTEKGFKRFYS